MKFSARNLTFAGSGLSLIATYAASATPIPLYGIYRAADGLSYGDLASSSVIYFAGAVTALLILGRLSDHLGRRPVALLALALAALACLCLLFVHAPGPLLAGRLLQGLSCGLASTVLASWLIDSAPVSTPWLAPAVISCGPMTGLTLGGLCSGALVQYSAEPRMLPFLVSLAVLLACTLLVAGGRETVLRKPGAIVSMRPNFGLPPTVRKAYPVAACVFVCTWALGGFYQAFGPAMAREQLHSSSALAAALVFASIMAPSILGASLGRRTLPRDAQRLGMLGFTVAVFGVLLSLQHGLLPAFLVASVVAGVAQGLALSGSIQSLVAGISLEERASVLAVIYATSYSGAAIPTLIAGRMSGSFSLLQVASAYGALAGVGCIVVFLAVRAQRDDRVRAS
ncbi:MFS transporter [Pseudomonas sp. A6]|uniref:MFS transporter n=1 Tax=Pseudomonas sp. A6 TaxID=410021 RepID=UPI004026426A